MSQTGIPLSYLGNVNDAVRIVQAQYPEAVLYVVDGTTADGKPTDDPRAITKLRVIFGYEGTTVFITSKETWGEWNDPTRIPEPLIGTRVIPWPINFDIVQAYEVLRQRGYTESFTTVTLRWPLYPGVEEPYYIFGLTSGQNVFVGVYTHTVPPALVLTK
ncbi:hypothetical protein NM688_g7181 [Phlebia brevispora]|uniref:Uncharacterized protein n=1 Tax=Phlebia brevispora TaxID=194682 RepID=A0ACC1S8B1_9APHY|nr:hypothetical protein NM688_g7181 [Phlebia brevispora]